MRIKKGDLVKIKQDSKDRRNKGHLLKVVYTRLGVVRVMDLESKTLPTFLVFIEDLEIVQPSEPEQKDELKEATKKWEKYFGRLR